MSITGVGPATGLPPGPGLPSVESGAGQRTPFLKTVEHFLGQASAQDAAAEQAVKDLATGKTDEIHDVMLALARADLSFRLVLEVRNRLTEAYQEIMRMQV
jgi:flagellar hook-basal body complex protein FliE